jgi:hypothetical protein
MSLNEVSKALFKHSSYPREYIVTLIPTVHDVLSKTKLDHVNELSRIRLQHGEELSRLKLAHASELSSVNFANALKLAEGWAKIEAT